MAKTLRGNAVVGQSGGPTAVINASLAGVIEEANSCDSIVNLYGALHAVAGIMQNRFVDLKKLSPERLEELAASPSAALGSSRDKPNEEYCARILETFRKRDVRYFYYIGGNDSANTLSLVNAMAQREGYEISCFHVPKTVDNDLAVTDHCPGYGSAARFVACALMGDDLDNRALPGIKIDVIMGRHAGFLTGAAVLGKQRKDDGPHLVYVPERPISMDRFIAEVKECHQSLGRCVVAVSEGICDEDGVTWAEKLNQEMQTDAHGNVQLSGSGALADFLAATIKKNLNIGRIRADTFGYLQRSFACLRSNVDAEEARTCGRQAVRLSTGHESGSVALKRLEGKERYAVEFFRTGLDEVAARTKILPQEFINAEGNGMTQAFIDYAAPLIGDLPRTCYLGDLPTL